MCFQSILPTIVDHISWDISTQQIRHYGQGLYFGTFRQFDYGDKNMEIYNSPTPPDYNLSNVIVPTYIHCGSEDLLVSKKVMTISIEFSQVILNPIRVINHNLICQFLN